LVGKWQTYCIMSSNAKPCC